VRCDEVALGCEALCRVTAAGGQGRDKTIRTDQGARCDEVASGCESLGMATGEQ